MDSAGWPALSVVWQRMPFPRRPPTCSNRAVVVWAGNDWIHGNAKKGKTASYHRQQSWTKTVLVDPQWKPSADRAVGDQDGRSNSSLIVMMIAKWLLVWCWMSWPNWQSIRPSKSVRFGILFVAVVCFAQRREIQMLRQQSPSHRLGSRVIRLQLHNPSLLYFATTKEKDIISFRSRPLAHALNLSLARFTKRYSQPTLGPSALDQTVLHALITQARQRKKPFLMK